MKVHCDSYKQTRDILNSSQTSGYEIQNKFGCSTTTKAEFSTLWPTE